MAQDHHHHWRHPLTTPASATASALVDPSLGARVARHCALPLARPALSTARVLFLGSRETRIAREAALRLTRDSLCRMGDPSSLFGSVQDSATMAKERYDYPVAIYVLTVLCALGLACVALAIADGWVLIATGAMVIMASLVRLHVILDRRRVGVGLSRFRWTAGRRRDGVPSRPGCTRPRRLGDAG